jgi:hypothetical protein
MNAHFNYVFAILFHWHSIHQSFESVTGRIDFRGQRLALILESGYPLAQCAILGAQPLAESKELLKLFLKYAQIMTHISQSVAKNHYSQVVTKCF